MVETPQGVRYKRNQSHVKLFNSRQNTPEPNMPEPVMLEPDMPEPIHSDSSPKQRPRREAKMPSRFKDYVV